ncbi:hypothetical protein Ancab_037767 [Ancistrocladus abbreviatus]
MVGGGGEEPPPSLLQPAPNIDGGEFLLRLVQKPQHQPHNPPVPQNLSLDPAVAAVGPAIPTPKNNNLDQPSLSRPPPPWSLAPSNTSPSPPYPPNFFLRGFPPNPPHWPQHQPLQPPPPTLGGPHQQFNIYKQQFHQQDRGKVLFGSMPFHMPNGSLVCGNFFDKSIGRENSSANSKFNFYEDGELGLNSRTRMGNGLIDRDWGSNPRGKLGLHGRDGVYGSTETRPPRPPPGFSSKPMNGRKSFEPNVGRGTSSSESNHRGRSSNYKNHEKEFRFSSADRDTGYSSGSGVNGLSGQLDHPGRPACVNLHSVSASDIEESWSNLHAEVANNGDRQRYGMGDSLGDDEHVHGRGEDEISDLRDHLADSLEFADESNGKNSAKKHHRDKDLRSDARGQQLLSQRMRNIKRLIECRDGIERLNAPFLAIYESLIPAEDEKAKQKQLLMSLEKLVYRELPNARLYLYGSCANSFGVSKSDIDVCLAIDDPDIDKSEVLLKLADILQSDNLENVQALTRARVPIVKLKDPETGISCDICVNNLLAVENTKLLRDYAEIDVRLRQLAFIVKHWAKSRGVNETYQGTLSSYAYVLMCIHFLQQRRPAILPCLQEMEATYVVTVDDVECAFFDQVEKLRDFGAQNKESIAQLVWAFFNYWAYCHDYANSVISVRTGGILSKQAKDWTRRIGNDRHLICIEDPFETSHDLGRVVDKYSIRVLREEFERAAEIMQYDPNPCVALFKPYIPS